MSERLPDTNANLAPAFKEGLQRKIIAGVLEKAKQQEFGPDADLFYGFAAEAFLRTGERDAALKLLDVEVGEDVSRIEILITLAEIEGIDSPLWSRATELADSNPHISGGDVNTAYGREQLLAGDVDGALRTARTREAFDLLAPIIECLLRRGEYEKAQGVISSLPDATLVIESVIRCLVNLGYTQEALVLADRVADNYRDNMYARIAYGQIGAGETRAARATILKITTESVKSHFEGFLHETGIAGRLKKGFLRVINQTAKVESPPVSPIRTAAQQVNAFLEADDYENAELAAQEVIRTAMTTPSNFRERYIVVRSLVRYQVAQGNTKEALLLIEHVPDEDTRAELYAFIASSEGPDSSLWTRGLREAEDVASFEILFDAAEEMRVEGGLNDSSALAEYPITTLSPRQLSLLGSHAYKQWASFKEYDEITFARLAHGAADVANGFMTDEDRRDFIRHLARQFAGLRDSGMLEEKRFTAVLKHMTEALAKFDDAGVISELLQAMQADAGSTVGLRILKALVESGNVNAAAAGIQLMSDIDTPPQVYRYLLYKLADRGYIDNNLPASIMRAQTQGFPFWASHESMSALYNQLGIQLDEDVYSWARERIVHGVNEPLDQMDLPVARELVRGRLQLIVAQVTSAKECFADVGPVELLEVLAANKEDALTYFLVNGGRTEYALIRHYNSKKFRHALKTASAIQKHVDISYVKADLWNNAPAGWMTAMVRRRRPDESLVWQVEVSVTTEELRATARATAKMVFGSELPWLLTAIADDKMPVNFANMPSEVASLDGSVKQRLQKLLGPAISAVVASGEGILQVGEFDKLKVKLLARFEQFASDPARAHESIEWERLSRQVAAEDSILAAKHVLTVMTRDPYIVFRQETAAAEWAGHMSGLASDLREAQRAGPEKRQLTIRYLDGKEDFIELKRFADGAQCCFTSEDSGLGQMDPDGDWRLRIDRDPHWFVFSIEDTPPNAQKRQSAGFVFGSLGYLDNQPAVLLNGIYMRRKTDIASNVILDEISTHFADRLGVPRVAIATTHGGAFAIDQKKWQRRPDGSSMMRPRAITEEDGKLEEDVYDDLGEVVNAWSVTPDYVWVRRI